MSPKAYKRTQRWFRMNPEKRREYNRRYYASRAQSLRDRARAARQANPLAVVKANRLFRERNPDYRREYAERRRLRDALRKFSTVLAANRAAWSEA